MHEKLTIGVITLGCHKNRIDIEEVLGKFKKHGYFISSRLEESEIIIVNTCAFIEEARLESIYTLQETVKYKNQGKCRILIATGCMPQKYSHLLRNKVPEIDILVGVHSYDYIIKLLNAALKNKARPALLKPPPNEYRSWGERVLTLPEYSAYLKIAEGCSNRCNYCAIPSIRGPYKSRPLKSILDEAEMLAKKGAREINLVAQDTTYYGKENGGEKMLPLLLNKMSRLKGIKWIRLLYAHPAHLDDAVIDILAKENKICPYIDLPLQHVNNRILKDMGRGYTKQHIVNLWRKLRQRRITIRSTFLIGFPSETTDDFNELISFIKTYPLDNVGVFLYSPEQNTRAYHFKEQIPLKVRQTRYHKLMSMQKQISCRLNQYFNGRTMQVLVERREYANENKIIYYRGRNVYQAPEIDGNVLISSKTQLSPGQMVPVYIYGFTSYDLLGYHVL